MSEFECSQGHMPAPSTIKNNRCPICGSPIVRIDGMSGRELEKMDREWDRMVEEDQKNEELYNEEKEGGEEG